SDGTDSWSFDLNGNPTMSGYTVDVGNRVTSANGWNYGYDEEGNVTSKVNASTTETWSYFYNQLNQLVKVEHKATSTGSVDLRVEFEYDVLGNRIEKSVDADGDGSGSAILTKYAYDQNANAWADLTSTGSLTTRRLYADAVDALMARISSTGNVDFYLTDR